MSHIMTAQPRALLRALETQEILTKRETLLDLASSYYPYKNPQEKKKNTHTVYQHTSVIKVSQPYTPSLPWTIHKCRSMQGNRSGHIPEAFRMGRCRMFVLLTGNDKMALALTSILQVSLHCSFLLSPADSEHLEPKCHFLLYVHSP